MSKNNVVVLVGGVGGAKLAYGLARVLDADQLTIIVNTGDDFWHYGLRICPDLDTVMYTLSDLVNRENGWGVAGESFNTLDALRRYGDEAWFRLGDKDFATHILRTQWWHEGKTLTEITKSLSFALDIGCTILPMTDSLIETKVKTAEYGELPFQQYFVKYRWQPVVESLRLEGIAESTLSSEVKTALEQADMIVFGPSNPWLSINPILSVLGMREALTARDIPRVAVTPIVQGDAIKGPAAKMMKEWGYEVSASEVARYYGSVINGFIYDKRDKEFSVETLQFVAMDTIMDTYPKREKLAKEVLNWMEELQI